MAIRVYGFEVVSMKVMSDILLQGEEVTTLTDCTVQRCWFLADVNTPPSTNPPMMVLIKLQSGASRLCSW